jgi:hypothetical protein
MEGIRNLRATNYQQYSKNTLPMALECVAMVMICVGTQNDQEPEALVQNYRNQTIRFLKLDPPILSGSMVVRGAAKI